ncbi:LysR substrate-binding domain-containing protein [Ancylobacter rudongensis]|uniref:DNA-binding transcriptional regulator, LysR family n=1 Tax=Ancylobacter rudongensis TaxID=177413 RepID=A0A1G4SEI5_9HYPH|nr:LysR substrate-binding domain-containing protein [Ancylobacter rudongensis]SCW66739.1 DNA-binding transcriptional regulator, LysR family [Ancylobacter rudongensis]
MIRTLEIVLLRTFVLMVEERSVTRVAEKLGRTQPAISLQIRRLEDAARRPLFESSLRQLRLTPYGEMLLPYARAVLRMHDEAQAKLASDEIEGRVTLACPDLYAAFLLPATLASFRAAYPRVEVSVRCNLTRQIAADMDSGLVDVAIVTRMPGVLPKSAHATHLREEALVWLGAEGGDAHRREPIPLALLPEGNLYRDLALMELNETGIKWRVACVSESIAGLQAMALADAAIIVLAESVYARGLVNLPENCGLPALPPVDLMLWRRREGLSEAAAHFASHIEGHICRERASPVAFAPTEG